MSGGFAGGTECTGLAGFFFTPRWFTAMCASDETMLRGEGKIALADRVAQVIEQRRQR